MNKKLKKTLWEHPYLLDRAFVMSRDEAASIVHAHVFPEFEAMLRGAAAKGGLPPASVCPGKEAAHSRPGRSFLRRPLPAAALLFAGALLFFTLAPPGRALAKRLLDMSVKVVGNVIYVWNEEREDTTNWTADFNGAPEESTLPSTEFSGIADENEMNFQTINDFYSATGLRPVILVGESIKISDITFYDGLGTDDTLVTIYDFENGSYATLIQEWGNQGNSAVRAEDGVYFERQCLNGINMYCLYDEADGSSYGIAVLENSVINFGTVDGADFEALIEKLSYYIS